MKEFQLVYFQLVSNFQLICERKISIGIYFKTLLKAKGRISFTGSFYLVKGKAFETGGGISKSKKCFLQSYFYTFDYLQKFLNRFPKDLQKQNLWCKCGPNYQIKESQTIHSYSYVENISLV
jgi:hypothetical protein